MIKFRFRFFGDDIYKDRNTLGWTMQNDDINININIILQYSKKTGIPFEILFSETVSHEVLHNAIDYVGPEDSGRDLDKICRSKQIRILDKFDLKKWHGGIPWWED